MGKDGAEVCRDERLALARDGAGDEDGLGKIELGVDFDRAVDAKEGLDAGHLLPAEHEVVLLVVLGAGEVGDDAEQVGADEGLDVPGALDAVVDEAQADGDGEEDEQADAEAGAEDMGQVGLVGDAGDDGGVERVQGDLLDVPRGGRLVEAVEDLDVVPLGDVGLVLEGLVGDAEVAELERVLLGVGVLGLEVGLALAGLGEARGKVGDGELDRLVELVLDDGDLVGQVDHLRVALEIALGVDRLGLEQAGELALEGRHRGMLGDVGDLRQVALLLLVGGDLRVGSLEVDAVEPRGGERGIHRGQARADDVGAVVEGDEVVLLLVRHQLLLGVGRVLAEAVGLRAEELDAGLAAPAVVVGEVAEELADKLVGDQRGGGRVGVADDDADEEAVAGGVDVHRAEAVGGRRDSLAGLEVLEVRALEGPDLVGGERLDDARAQPLAVQFLEIGAELGFVANGRVDDPLGRDEGFRFLELHRGDRLVHLRLARLPVAEAEGDDQRQRQRDPHSLPEDDVVVAERAPLDRRLVLVVRRGERLGGVFLHRWGAQMIRSGT